MKFYFCFPNTKNYQQQENKYQKIFENKKTVKVVLRSKLVSKGRSQKRLSDKLVSFWVF